ncbi:MAG: M23 family metallopeptidase [Salinibacter sp.]|uniref:M23 family metallopeptidase n=1 Tax=Salinibacter sp. TaxID=2065818 RepID=UPI0035D49A00
MWKFLVDLVRHSGVTHTLIMMDAEEMGETRRYQIQPERLLLAWGGSLLVGSLIAGALLSFTPLRSVFPGHSTEQIRESAQLNAVRLRALQDSIAVQRQYIERLQQLITGKVDPAAQSDVASPAESPSSTPRPRRGQNPGEATASSKPDGHGQPAIPPSRTPVAGKSPSSGLSFPVRPPVMNGFPTREFNAKTGHYGVDLAVSEGEFVRAIGEGYVVLADWTRDGGYTIAVQHGGGYLSIYKHNKRLLKQLGDRIQAREPLAVSGNTGEITTGPHLHFELWRNGLAQDPQSYVTDW